MKNEKQILSDVRCPECDGSNLNEEKTICWDCQSFDYIDRG